jgi:hypothetical protein
LVIVAAVLARNAFYRPVSGGKGELSTRLERPADRHDDAVVVNIGLMITPSPPVRSPGGGSALGCPKAGPPWVHRAWKEFQLGSVLIVTVQVVFAVVALAPIGVPAAYTLARRTHRQAFPDAAVPAAADGPADYVRYSDGDRAVQGAAAGTIYGVILANPDSRRS